MAENKRILVVISGREISMSQPLPGIVAYQARHPHLHLDFCLLDEASGNHGQLLKRNIVHFRPDGVLAAFFWPGAVRDIPRDLPVVNFSDIEHPHIPTVIFDQVRIGKMAAEHLREQDLPHYAFAALRRRGWGARLRWQGFHSRLLQAGHEAHLFDSSFPDTAHLLLDEDLRNWLQTLPKPIGIHAHYLVLAMRLLWACQDWKFRVPEDVALIAGADMPLLTTMWAPAISAFRLDSREIGYEALRMLDRLLAGEAAPAGPVLILPQQLIVRQSSDRRGMRDPLVAQMRRLIAGSRQPITTKELLGRVRHSRRTLERHFQRHLGRSLHDEIVAVRIARAQQLLQDKILPVKEIARQSGYATYHSFAAAFLRVTGVRVSDYRRGTSTHVLPNP